MFVEIVHENGKRYTMPVSQAVVYVDSGEPCAITYEHAGIVIHSDTEHKDFATMCQELKIKNLKPEEVSG